MIDTNTDMRWMLNNFLEAGLASLSVSSVNSDYPLENLTDGSQRSKVFKFGGRFLIDSTNNKIYINASTYTIPSADYNDLSSLITAINIVTAGVADFAFDGATLVVGVSHPSGLTLKLSTRTNAIWDTLGFTSIIDQVISGSIYHSASEARMHWPHEEITVNFGYQAPIGFVGIISDLADELKIPQGALLEILGNNVNSFTSPPLHQTIPWYTTGAFKFIDDTIDSSWQYVKIRITCPSGPFIPEIGFLYLGDYQTLQDRNISTGIETTYIDPSDQSQSDAGQIYSNTRTPFRQFSSLVVGLSRPAHNAFLKNAFKKKQKSTPFFVALDPKVCLSSSPDEYLAYVRFTDSPRYKHIIKDIFESSFELREAL